MKYFRFQAFSLFALSLLLSQSDAWAIESRWLGYFLDPPGREGLRSLEWLRGKPQIDSLIPRLGELRELDTHKIEFSAETKNAEISLVLEGQVLTPKEGIVFGVADLTKQKEGVVATHWAAVKSDGTLQTETLSLLLPKDWGEPPTRRLRLGIQCNVGVQQLTLSEFGTLGNTVGYTWSLPGVELAFQAGYLKSWFSDGLVGTATAHLKPLLALYGYNLPLGLGGALGAHYRILVVPERFMVAPTVGVNFERRVFLGVTQTIVSLETMTGLSAFVGGELEVLAGARLFLKVWSRDLDLGVLGTYVPYAKFTSTDGIRSISAAGWGLRTVLELPVTRFFTVRMNAAWNFESASDASRITFQELGGAIGLKFL